MKEMFKSVQRVILLGLGVFGLLALYLFQQYLDFYQLLRGEALRELYYSTDFKTVNPRAFCLNKVGRYVLNDLFTMAIIAALFPQGRYFRFALMVLIFGLVVLLPSYLILYLAQPSGFSSLIAHLHRLVMNPVLLLLLIPAFYYQQKLNKEPHRESQ